MKPLLLYTMTSGLGDFIVMGDLMKKVERLVPQARCLMAHRGNPHIKLWPYDPPDKRFFDVYQPKQFLRLILTLKKAKKNNFTIFGLQMAPGSIQGFLFHLFLKKLKALDFIVDFNLINADIITPPKGNYILDLHLNQIKNLLKIEIPENFYRLELPIRYDKFSIKKMDSSQFQIGIHPWSRRGHLPCFVWSFENWLKIIRFLLQYKQNRVIIFGKDKKFNELRNYLKIKLDTNKKQLVFSPCDSVKELIKTIEALDLMISVNTGVVHIGYALNKKMIILCGPSLDLWIPKGKNIKIIYDEEMKFNGSDKYINNNRFPSVSKIKPFKVIKHLKEMRSSDACRD